MTYFDVLSSLAARLVVDPAFFDEIMAAGINPKTWPECPQKQLAEQYMGLRESNGHEYASWKLSNSVDAQKVSGQAAILPVEPEAIQALYRDTQMVHRAERLGSLLIQKPREAIKLIRDFEQDESSAVHMVDFADQIREFAQDYDSRVQAGTSVVEISGWPGLSRTIGGFNPQRLAICKAITGWGKTNLAINLALAASKTMNVTYFNMEMGLPDVFERFYAILTGKPFSVLRKEGVGDLETGLRRYRSTRRLSISDGRDHSLPEIKAECRRRTRISPPGLIIVDYDQKIELETAKGVPEWKALQSAMVGLEGLAKEMNAFVLVLAQTNQEGTISGSFRSQFPAASVWHFQDHDEFGPVISFEKNRFGERRFAVRVNYETHTARITEATETGPGDVPVMVRLPIRAERPKL